MNNDRPEAGTAGSNVDAEEVANSRLVPQLEMMARALWAAPVRSTLLLLSGSIFFVIAATAYGQIRLNSWNQPFYDALSHRNFAQFLDQLGIFGLIAGTLLVLNVGQRWLTETLKLKLRQGLVHDLIQAWLVPGRAFRLTNAGTMGVNPDQRMHEDARHLTELSADLGIGLLQSSILLATFVKVLWNLSNNFAFHFDGRQIVIPGYMVWAAVLYSGSASLVSYWVGKPLVDRNADRYAREADLRFSLVRVNEHIDAITLNGGEADEARRIELDLKGVLKATTRLVTGLTNLTWVTAGYGWFTLVAPILVAAPLYFAGNLTFGGLMLASGAFLQVQSSLRWFVDNFSTIADWRATLLRVAGFRRAVLGMDVMHDVESRIVYAAGKAGEFEIDDLRIASPSGCTMLQEKRAQIKVGERVLIVGDSGTGKTLLFRALAGLWPWGTGNIAYPAGEEILYIPRTRYFPPGTLRELLAYPKAVDLFESAACSDALALVGLKRLIPLLDSTHRWDREMNEDEQNALALARVLVHKAPWVIIDEILDSLDDRALNRFVEIFTQHLPHCGVIHIGRSDAHQFFSRVLHLVNDSTAKKLIPPASPAALLPATANA
ncbi:MAG TPA: ABC transporter ATP-binding protein/permease [Steroidobacteraceae bacterium]|jgi:putative ATP-binding cassette transporter|nr:ABC transporter ATP-binding protein/permease [Steroidobacteraceae bacterium]